MYPVLVFERTSAEFQSVYLWHAPVSDDQLKPLAVQELQGLRTVRLLWKRYIQIESATRRATRARPAHRQQSERASAFSLGKGETFSPIRSKHVVQRLPHSHLGGPFVDHFALVLRSMLRRTGPASPRLKCDMASALQSHQPANDVDFAHR
jgi:hypothetical protein